MNFRRARVTASALHISVFALTLVSAIMALGLVSSDAYPQGESRESFETKIFSIEGVSHFGVDEERFVALTAEQKASLLEARTCLMAMLQSIQKKRDITRYASPDMLVRYRTSAALATSLIEPETSILAAGVSDFALVDSRTISLNFLAVVSSEGNIVVSEKVALLKQTDSGWRFAGLK